MFKKNAFLGLILIFLGVILIITNLFRTSIFYIPNLWPAIILIPGIYLEVLFFTKIRDPRILIAGGILTTIGLSLLFQPFLKLNLIRHLLPILPLSIAIGLLQLYIFGRRSRQLGIIIFTLILVSAIAWFLMFLLEIFSLVDTRLIFSFTLMIAGIVIFLKSQNNRGFF